jgi:hypothetical protein
MKRIISMAVVAGMLMGNVYAMNSMLAMEEGQSEGPDYAFRQLSSSFLSPEGESIEFVTVSPDNAAIIGMSPFGKAIYVTTATIANAMRSRKRIEYSEELTRAAFSSDSRKAALGIGGSGPDYGFRVLDVIEDNILRQMHEKPYASDMQCRFLNFTQDNGKIIAADENEVRIVNYANGDTKRVELVKDSQEDAIAACILKQEILYALLCSGIAKRINVTTYESLPDITYNSGRVKMCPGRWGITVSASQDRIAMIKEHGAISVHDLETGAAIQDGLSFKNGEHYLADNIALSPNGEKLACDAMGAQEGCICIADVDRSVTDQGKCIMIVFGKYALSSLAFSPDSQNLLAVSGDGKRASIFNVVDGSEIFNFKLKYSAISGQFSPNGILALIACRDGKAGAIEVAGKKSEENNIQGGMRKLLNVDGDESSSDDDDECELQDDADDSGDEGNRDSCYPF